MEIGNPITLTNNVASKSISINATANQTQFTVDGGYRVNQLAVFRNGVRLVDGQDFTARDGSLVILLQPANLGDTIEFQIFDDFRVADAIVSVASTQVIHGDLTVTGTLRGTTIGISSGGVEVGTAKTINFIGVGNTVDIIGDTADVYLNSGNASRSGIGTAIKLSDDVTNSPFSYIDRYITLEENMVIDTSNAGLSTSIVVTATPNVEVAAGVALTVGTDKTVVIDALQIGGDY